MKIFGRLNHLGFCTYYYYTYMSSAISNRCHLYVLKFYGVIANVAMSPIPILRKSNGCFGGIRILKLFRLQLYLQEYKRRNSSHCSPFFSPSAASLKNFDFRHIPLSSSTRPKCYCSSRSQPGLVTLSPHYAYLSLSPF